MTLRERVNEDVKAAMKAREAERLGTLRLLTAAMKQREVDERITLDDAGVIAVIEKMLKQRKDSVAQYEQAGRQDLADVEKREMADPAGLPAAAADRRRGRRDRRRGGGGTRRHGGRPTWARSWRSSSRRSRDVPTWGRCRRWSRQAWPADRVAESARIVGVGIVGNEADVIEAFVRHHARLLDELVLVVHRPVDETRAILESLAAEGLPLVLRDARHAAFRQADETSGVARELLRSGADFIVLLDADEFLRLPDRLPAPGPAGTAGRPLRRVALAVVRAAGGGRRPRANPLRRIRHRRREEGFDCFKVALTRAFLREEFHLLEGNHCVMQAGDAGTAAPAPMTEYKAVRLAHFPVRSREQLEAKVVLGELGKREAQAEDPALGTHWRDLYRMIRDHGPLDAQALRRVAVRYAFPGDAQLDLPADGLVEDPVPADFELRYLPAGTRTALQTVLRWLDSRAARPRRRGRDVIPQDFIQTLLGRVDIVEVIDRHVRLKKAGANYKACCPFHNEKTPSFNVSPTKQFYHCFGCGAHGNAIGFVMEYSGLTYPDAIRELAQQVGMEVPEVRSAIPGRPAPAQAKGLATG